MKTLGIALVALTAFSAPAAAQVTGSTNRNAPKMEQTCDLGSERVLTLNYTAITFAGGNWAASLADESRRDRMKAYINGKADSAPIAFFETTSDMMINETRVAAGEYDMAFVLNDDFKWDLRLKSDSGSIMIALNLTDSPMASKRLIMSLHGGEEDGTAGVYIAFGEQIGTLDLTPAPEKKADGARK